MFSSGLKHSLEKETKEVADVLFFAWESFGIVKCIIRDEGDEDKAYIKKMSSFFQLSLGLYWRITVIELWKLFSTSTGDKFRLTQFLNKLKPGGLYELAAISLDRIKGWEEAIEAEKDNIDNLKLQRNKVYAHKDLDHDTVTNTVSLKKIEELIKLAQDIIHEIHLVVFNRGFSFNAINSPVENLEYLLNCLARDKKNEDERRKKYV